jgi:hypothetical protein
MVMATQIRRDLYADVTGLALGNGVRSRTTSGQPKRVALCLDWPNPNHWETPMVEATRNLSHASTKYWVDVILTTALDCRPFDCEREALAWAQVCARLPNAELVVAFALTEGRKKTIFEWSEAE